MHVAYASQVTRRLHALHYDHNMPAFKTLATNMHLVVNFWNFESEMLSPAKYRQGRMFPFVPPVRSPLQPA